MPIYMFLNPGEQFPAPLLQVQIYFTTWSHYQFLLHDTQTVLAWPDTARKELFAVARRDIAVARRNLASLTRYVDMHDVHLVACSGGLDDSIPLMTVETFSRATGGGGVRSVLDEADRTM